MDDSEFLRSLAGRARDNALDAALQLAVVWGLLFLVRYPGLLFSLVGSTVHLEFSVQPSLFAIAKVVFVVGALVYGSLVTICLALSWSHLMEARLLLSKASQDHE